MVELLHQLASGLALGGVYAITALALVMIFQATQLVNFAQGEMAMFSTYVAWALLQNGWSYWRPSRSPSRFRSSAASSSSASSCGRSRRRRCSPR